MPVRISHDFGGDGNRAHTVGATSAIGGLNGESGRGVGARTGTDGVGGAFWDERLRKLEISVFSGDDACGWVNRVE